MPKFGECGQEEPEDNEIKIKVGRRQANLFFFFALQVQTYKESDVRFIA